MEAVNFDLHPHHHLHAKMPTPPSPTAHPRPDPQSYMTVDEDWDWESLQPGEMSFAEVMQYIFNGMLARLPWSTADESASAPATGPAGKMPAIVAVQVPSVYLTQEMLDLRITLTEENAWSIKLLFHRGRADTYNEILITKDVLHHVTEALLIVLTSSETRGWTPTWVARYLEPAPECLRLDIAIYDEGESRPKSPVFFWECKTSQCCGGPAILNLITGNRDSSSSKGILHQVRSSSRFPPVQVVNSGCSCSGN